MDQLTEICTIRRGSIMLLESEIMIVSKENEIRVPLERVEEIEAQYEPTGNILFWCGAIAALFFLTWLYVGGKWLIIGSMLPTVLAIVVAALMKSLRNHPILFVVYRDKSMEGEFFRMGHCSRKEFQHLQDFIRTINFRCRGMDDLPLTHEE